MTLEERALKFLTEKYNLRDPKIYNRMVVSDEEKGIHAKGLHELLAEFTREQVKAKLQEAAEKKENKILMNILEDDYELNKQFHEESREMIYSFAVAHYREKLTLKEWLKKYYNQ